MQHRKLPDLDAYEHELWPHLHENKVQRTLGFFKALNRGLHLVTRRLLKRKDFSLHYISMDSGALKPRRLKDTY